MIPGICIFLNFGIQSSDGAYIDRYCGLQYFWLQWTQNVRLPAKSKANGMLTCVGANPFAYFPDDITFLGEHNQGDLNSNDPAEFLQKSVLWTIFRRLIQMRTDQTSNDFLDRSITVKILIFEQIRLAEFANLAMTRNFQIGSQKDNLDFFIIKFIYNINWNKNKSQRFECFFL